MFKVIDLPPEAGPEESLDAGRACPPEQGTIRWVDLTLVEDQTEDTSSLASLQQAFGFHPLEIEDCASFELRSKIDEYPDHLFVVLHTFTPASDDPSEIQIHEVHAFVGRDYLVTVHDNLLPAAEAVWSKAARSRADFARGPAWLLYLTADAMVDAIFPMLGDITQRLEDVEDALLSDVETEYMTEIFRIKRALVGMRRVIRGTRDVVGILARRTTEPLGERSALYFRDVHDHVIRCSETIEEALALADNAMDTYQTAISNRTSEIIRRLTLFSVIFLPLGFITGFWGQNFAHLPLDVPWVFYFTLGLSAGIPGSLLVWFWRKGWL